MRRIERNHLLSTHSSLDHVKYGWGSKASFKTPASKIKELDCSGYVRYLLYHASDGKVRMPAGSWNQRKWCETEKLQSVEYASIGGKSDNVLRIAFIRPKKNSRLQHVWLVLNGNTMESHGSKGVNRRSAKTHILFKNVDDCYELAATYLLTLGPLTVRVGKK